MRDAGLAETAGRHGHRARRLARAPGRRRPLNAGLLALLVATGLILAGYAALGLVLTVVATSRERGRTLSALRTLGLDARTARAMTFGELAPLALAAVLAGTAIGIAVPWLLTGALGLDLLTGDPAATSLQVTWVPIVAATVVVLASLVRRGGRGVRGAAAGPAGRGAPGGRAMNEDRHGKEARMNAVQTRRADTRCARGARPAADRGLR